MLKVLLSGDCADECFGGYSWYKHLNLVQKSAGEKFDTYPISYQNFGIPEKSRLEQMKSYSAQQRAWAWHYYAHEQEKEIYFRMNSRMVPYLLSGIFLILMVLRNGCLRGTSKMIECFVHEK